MTTVPFYIPSDLTATISYASSDAENGFGITDRLRFTIIEANTNNILSRDLVVREPKVMLNLSSPSRCSFKVPQGEQLFSASGIDFKTWGYWIIPEIEINGKQYCLGAQMVSKADVDQKSGDMVVEGLGFMGYPKGIPWLADYNPIAVDPAEVIQKIWADCQNYTNANLGVQVLPASTGTQMLPGYSFDGNTLNFDFFAMFVRKVDFQDSGDMITGLARDIPLDMLEEVSWDTNRTTLTKTLRIGYPYLGTVQEALTFVVGENVIVAECAEELEIEPVSDIIVRSWRPGATYSSQLTNVDPTRFRRVIMEEDAHIDSVERAAAWAKRRLTRRNIPKSFSKITIDLNHPNAPVGSFWVGDTVWVEAKNYPWKGDISGWHRITGITFNDDQTMAEIDLKVEGAFNYDPIEYNPDYATEPTEDLNKLANGYFNETMTGWTRNQGQWIYTKQDGYTSPGCVYVYCDDGSELLESHRVAIDLGQTVNISAWVKRQTVAFTAGTNYNVHGIYISVKTYLNGGIVSSTRLNGLAVPDGTGPWTKISGTYTAPSNGTVNEISVVLSGSNMTSGIMWWDDVRIDPA